MKDSVLHALAERWDRDAEDPNCQDGSESARIGNAIAKGEREAMRRCASQLRTLIAMLGDGEDRSGQIQKAASKSESFELIKRTQEAYKEAFTRGPEPESPSRYFPTNGSSA